MFYISFICRCFYSKRHGVATKYTVSCMYPGNQTQDVGVARVILHKLNYKDCFIHLFVSPISYKQHRPQPSKTLFKQSLTFSPAHIVKRRRHRPSKRNRCTPKTARSSIKSSQSCIRGELLTVGLLYDEVLQVITVSPKLEGK